MELRIFQLDPLLVASSVVLSTLPILLVLAFKAHGQPARIENIRSYFRPGLKARDLLSSSAAAKATDSEVSLIDYLEQRYRKRHATSQYLIPLFIFLLVYVFLIYWSFVALDMFAAGKAVPDSDEGSLWWTASLGAAGSMGAILLVLWHLFWRSMRSDLQPTALLHSAARLTVAPFVGIVVGAVIPVREGLDLLVSFLAGFFAQDALRLLESRWRDLSGLRNPATQLLPVRSIEGISANDEIRLWEEGVTDAQHLAVETVENLLINTPYSLERIIDWKDQALLYAYVGDEITIWRSLQNRGAMDVLGIAPGYYGAGRYAALVTSLSQALKKDKPAIERFVDTIYQDPRVHQLWRYLNQSYPATIAQSIHAKSNGEAAATASSAKDPKPNPE